MATCLNDLLARFLKNIVSKISRRKLLYKTQTQRLHPASVFENMAEIGQQGG